MPVTDDKGVITSYISVRTDITEIKKKDELLRRTQKLDSIADLSGGIAHDFNNMLGFILGYVDVMTLKVANDSELNGFLNKIDEAAVRGTELSNRLQSFSRQDDETHIPTDINSVISNLSALLKKSLASNINIKMELADDLPLTEINPGDFEDVLINMSNNANHAMPEGGTLIYRTRNESRSELNIKTFDLPVDEYVTLEISDTGSGMSEEVAAKIFDPFFTTKSDSNSTGLGLTMVYGFVNRLGGYIDVDSTEGVGTTFKIYFPKSNQHAGLSDTRSKLPAIEAKGSETILVVDDERDLVSLAEEILSDFGYTIVCAYDGNEALDILEKRNDIDLLFSDAVMPEISGFRLAARTRELHSDLKVLIASGYIGNIPAAEADEEWLDSLLSKPYRRRELASRVRQTLDQ